MDEPELIARYFAPLAGPAGLGLRDDAALLAPPPGCELVLTADALVAGRHFFASDPPETIAAKALGVNLSDLAAKGAAPLGFLLTLALPQNWREDWTQDWLASFAAGLGAAAGAGGCPLLGGDTVATSGPLTLSVTALGAVPSGTMLRRSGARVGDGIFVSGTIGDAALGLLLRRAEVLGEAPPAWASALTDEQRAFLIDRYLRPRARLALAEILRAKASAGMDVSDGLAGDLRALMRASNLAARVALARIPLSDAAAAALAAEPALRETICCGGDDYEILCTAPKNAFLGAPVEGIGLTRIGEVVAGEAGAEFLDENEAAVKFFRERFSHF